MDKILSIVQKAFLISVSYMICSLMVILLPEDINILIYYLGLSIIGMWIYKLNRKGLYKLWIIVNVNKKHIN